MRVPAIPSRAVPGALFRLISILGLGAAAAGAAPMKFEIPAQPAPAALMIFSKQARVEVVFSSDDLKQVRANEVMGEYEPEDALGRLLKNTGYAAQQNGGGKFVIAREVTQQPGSIEGAVREAESGKPVIGARVNLAGTDRFALTDKRGRFSFAEVPAGAQGLHITAEGRQNTRVTDVTVKAGQQHTLSPITIPVKAAGILQLEDFVVSAKKNDGVVELAPYEVTGIKQKPFTTANVDIPRTINDVQPYYILEAKTIEQSGSPDIEDFLKQRLTMNAVGSTNSRQMTGSGTFFGNTSAINLRGLGADKTLILVNGRRIAGVILSSEGPGQPDLNGIPLGAIDRIEILPSSASGIYGGNALGGVINVVLKRDYSGGEVRAVYDNTWDTDARVRTISLNYGLGLRDGKTHVGVSASWSDSTSLLLQDRPSIYADNLATIIRNAPTYILLTTVPRLGALPNITPGSTAATNLTLRNGQSLNSRNTFVPAGTSTATPAADLAAALLANAGKWNTEFPPTAQTGFGLLQPFGVIPRKQAYAFDVRRRMLPNLELFASFAHNANASASAYNPNVSFLAVPAASPVNPFTAAVRVRVPLAAVVEMTTNSRTEYLALGGTADLPGGWVGELDYTFSENRYDYSLFAMDSAALTADLASGAVNPFVDTLRFPFNVEKYFSPQFQNGSLTQHDVAARAAGPLPELPWGAPRLAVGLERRLARSDEITSGIDYAVTKTNSYRMVYYPREQVTQSAYAEAQVPLARPGTHPLLHALEAQLSGRVDRYAMDTGTPYKRTAFSTTPPTVTYGTPTNNGLPFFSSVDYTALNTTLGLKYQPVPDVTLRASRGTAFLPPTPGQLIRNPAVNPGTTTVADPKTNTQTEVQTISGGNPDLVPQSALSFNLGAIWTPQWRGLAGLRINLEYYRIRQSNYIDSLSAQQVVAQEALYANRVSRNSAGEITTVDTSLVNLYGRETEGWDLAVDYTRKTGLGTFSLTAAASTIIHLKSQFAPDLPEYDAVNFPAEEGAAKHKANISVNWERHGWTAGWTMRYFGAYKQYGAAGGPSSVMFQNGGPSSGAGSFLPPQGGDSIPSQAYHDLVLGYSFPPVDARGSSGTRRLRVSLLAGLSVQVGLRNIFDKAPPFDVFYGYYSSPYGDSRLRSYWVSLRKQF